jgi:hypothetical protein
MNPDRRRQGRSAGHHGLDAREALVIDSYLPKLLSLLVLGCLTALTGVAIEWDRRRRVARLPMRSHALRNRGVH